MSKYAIKLGVCIAIGLVGFAMVMLRSSIESIIIGFLIVSVAVVFGSYFNARLRQAKNPMSPEIEELLRRAQGKEK
jgi:hypothetical protein